MTPRLDAICGLLDFAWQIMISCVWRCQGCQICPSGGEQQVLLDATGRPERLSMDGGALSLLEGVADSPLGQDGPQQADGDGGLHCKLSTRKDVHVEHTHL